MKHQIFMALKAEAQDYFRNEVPRVIFTGIGKTNVADKLLEFLLQQHDLSKLLLINLGTAGSDQFPIGTLVEISQFHERGVDFKSEKIISSRKATSLPSVVCGTGEKVEPIKANDPWRIVDMEAYVYARICKNLGISFVSIKYISDGSDQNVFQNWKQSLDQASQILFQFWNENHFKIINAFDKKI